MAVTVGTDVYDTVANTDAYWSARGNTDWAALDTDAKEINLVKATDWIERNFRFRGKRLTQAQTLAWPRQLAFDDDGYPIGETEAPLQVKRAMYLVADVFREGVYDLQGVVTDDVAVERQKVDVIEIEYDTTKKLRGQDVVSYVYQTLGPMLTSNYLLRA